MKTIWKFPIEVVDEQDIEAPRGTNFLSVQLQNGIICIYGVVDPNEIKMKFNIRIFGTGNPFDLPLRGEFSQFLGTVFAPPFVWHVFHNALRNVKAD